MKKIGLFGGTFNPVHNGHVRLLKTADESMCFDELIVMPSKIPPHKKAEGLVSGKHRVNMLGLAFEDSGKVSVSDYELKRRGKSYSVYTLRYLKKQYPDDKLYFIMGSDMLLCFDKWYRYEEILTMTSLVCLSRDDEDTSEKLRECADKLREKGAEVILLDAEPYELSSSEIRQKLRESQDCSCYLPKKIVQYICDNKLYR